MEVRWTETAVADLERIVLFLEETSPAYSQRVAGELYDEVNALHSMPHRGRPGAEPGTRELVVPSSGYIVTYEVVLDAVFILRLHHGAQQWPRR